MSSYFSLQSWITRRMAVAAGLLCLALGLVSSLPVAGQDPALTSARPGIPNDAASPLRAVLSLEKLPLRGQAVVLTCEVTSDLAATGVTVDVVLPRSARVLSGDLFWQGDLAAGETVEVKAWVALQGLGDTSLFCRTEQVLDADNSFGDLAALYLSVGQDATIAGFTPVPVAELIPLGEMAEAGDGVDAKVHPDQWKWNRLDREVPPAPELVPLRVGEERAAGRIPLKGNLTVTGTWKYFDRNDSLIGAREMLVEAVRGDNGNHLAWCYTNLSGYYSCGPFTNPGAAGVRTLVHSYTSYLPNPDLLIVKHPDYSGTNPGQSFRVQTQPQVLPDGTWSMGTWLVPNGSDYERAFWSQRDLVDTWRFIYFNGGIGTPGGIGTSGPCTVLWKIDSTDGEYYSPGGQVHLTGLAPLSDTVVIHEYSHNLMYTTYGNYLPPTPSCNPHTIQGTSSTGCAWVEGWAEFIPMVVNNDPYYRWASGAQLNLETPTWGTFGWDDGDDVEGRVAGALWDVYDIPNDGFDQYTQAGGLAPFWDVFYNQNDDNFLNFCLAWLSYGYPYDGPLNSIYQNTIDY